MSVVKKVRASLVELYTRVIEVDERNKNIYKSGENNLYPYEIERAINNSPTATRASYIMSKFISGKGVLEDKIVNTKKGYFISDVVNIVSEDISDQYGSFIWVGYGIDENGNIYRKTLDVIDYSNCRKSKEDDHEYPGRIFVKDYSKVQKVFRAKSNDDDAKWYYPFNPNPDIVKAQMKADAREKLGKKDNEDVTIDEMVQNYRGQVYYLNLTPRYQYALSKFDSVFNDMDSEYRFSLYVNTQMREGFLGKTVVITQGLDEETETKLDKDLGMFLGAEQSGSLYRLNVDSADDLAQVMRIEQLKPQLDDKLFVENDKRIRRNILGAANNLPEPLIYAGEGALFGTSADAYTEMKQFYQEQTQNERKALEKAFKKLGFEVKIKTIIPEENAPEDNQE